MSKTVNINSVDQFNQILSKSRIVVADFYANWCGPCKVIAPLYEQLSAQLSRPDQMTFTKINTDEQQVIARTHGITAMPTFLIFKQGKESSRIQGADPTALSKAVTSLQNEASSSSSSSSSSSASWRGMEIPKGYSDVTSSIDIRGLDVLNLSSEGGITKSIFSDNIPNSLSKGKSPSGTENDYIESDTDEQLMLFIPFQSTLKIHSLHITSCVGDEVMRPKTIKFYTNRANVLGFDEADSIEAVQTIELTEKDWDKEKMTAKLDLRFVKFQNVTSLVIYIVDGEGDGEKVRIDRLRILGETGEKRAMGKLEKVGHDAE